MKKYIVFLAICLSSYVFAGKSFDIEIGSQLPTKAIDTGVMLMTSPAQFRKAYEIEIDNNIFTVCPNEHKEVVHIVTKSSQFSTPEGIHVGDTYNKVQKITNHRIEKWPGWAFVVTLPSGWKAAFIQGKTMIEGKLGQDSTVAFIFKGSPSG